MDSSEMKQFLCKLQKAFIDAGTYVSHKFPINNKLFRGLSGIDSKLRATV